MTKARSRLDLSQIDSSVERQSPNQTRSHKTKTGKMHLLQRYLKHSPTLLLSLPFFAVLWFIFTTFKPAFVKNLVLTNSYLVVIVPFFLAGLFAISFLLLKTRRGFAVSLLLTLMLFLKLQQVQLNLPLVLMIVAITLGPLFLIEIFARFFKKN